MRLVPLVILGGAAAVALVVPSLVDGPDRVDAQCLAAFGSLNDGVCLDGPSAPPPDFPSFGVGPTGDGPGLTTGPLLPGQTVQFPLM